jgi:PAS domain S-box-containing protein
LPTLTPISPAAEKCARQDNQWGRSTSCPEYLGSLESQSEQNGADEHTCLFSRQLTQIDNMINETASESVIHSAVRDAVVDLDFCVSIVDPRSETEELIAVSGGFEKMTGYSSEEVVGKNCRFLNDGCELQPWQRRGLRVASKTGALFSAVIINRKKSGEFFKNFINVRLSHRPARPDGRRSVATSRHSC